MAIKLRVLKKSNTFKPRVALGKDAQGLICYTVLIMEKKLYREEEEAMVVGVVAGLAKYFKQDPALFRVLAVVFLVVTGFFPGILLYLGAWIVMPKKPKADYIIVE